jgi:hypothetical protein
MYNNTYAVFWKYFFGTVFDYTVGNEHLKSVFNSSGTKKLLFPISILPDEFQKTCCAN